ncbi:hypothetical protein ACWD4N_00710 [Streptomyces sp. NPDC002586]
MRTPASTEDELAPAGALVEELLTERRTKDPGGAGAVELMRLLPAHSIEALTLPGFRSPGNVSRKPSGDEEAH